MKIDIWRIISWICILFGFTYDYINISEHIKRIVTFVCIMYLVGYSIFSVIHKKK